MQLKKTFILCMANKKCKKALKMQILGIINAPQMMFVASHKSEQNVSSDKRGPLRVCPFPG
jgi:hypothetical protein